MIACPKCGSDTQVTETRNVASGTRRRRRCTNANCLFRVTTAELILPVPGRGAPRDPVIVSRQALAELARSLETPTQPVDEDADGDIEPTEEPSP